MQTTPRPTGPSSTPFLARLVGIQVPEIREIWPIALEHLGPAIELTYGRHSPETVLSSLLDGNMQLWLAVTDRPIAAAITQVNIWPTGMKTCRIMFVGGTEMNRWTYMMEIIGEWAITRNCRYLEVGGRSGWEKVLGWKKSAVELVKDLADA